MKFFAIDWMEVLDFLRYFGAMVVPAALALIGALWVTWATGFPVWQMLFFSLGAGVCVFIFMTFCCMALDLDFD